MITTESGTYRIHLSGELAFRSFIPQSLWDAAIIKGENSLLWHQCEEISKAVAHTAEIINRFREKWSSAEPEIREAVREELLRREAEASVCMAFPVQAAAPAFDYSDIGSAGDVPFPWMNLMEKQQMASAESDSLLDRIPEEFRRLADEDMENLYEAGRRSLEMMDSLPLSGRLLKELHYIILYGAHYDKLYRGEFRRSPVWIGGPGTDLCLAEIVPPAGEDMTRAFSDLETFLHYADEVDPLVKSALIHYQFETIHPFLDGNGRIGRLLVLLYLKETCRLECPWIQLSPVLLQGMDRYYKEIRTVQLYGDYQRWTLWFLRCLEDAAARASNQITVPS